MSSLLFLPSVINLLETGARVDRGEGSIRGGGDWRKGGGSFFRLCTVPKYALEVVEMLQCTCHNHGMNFFLITYISLI